MSQVTQHQLESLMTDLGEEVGRMTAKERKNVSEELARRDAEIVSLKNRIEALEEALTKP